MNANETDAIEESPRLKLEREILAVVEGIRKGKKRELVEAALELEKEFSQRVEKLEAKEKKVRARE